MWQQFWINFLSSLLAGVALGILGLSGYFLYKKNIIQKGIKQKSNSGNNWNIGNIEIYLGPVPTNKTKNNLANNTQTKKLKNI
jgi:hypothetical protein